MSSQPIPYVTPEEYLKFDRNSEFRHEYIFGEIVRITAGTYNHSVIGANTLGTLRNLLSNKPCRVLDATLRVLLHRGTLYCYPDVTVVCGKPQFLDEEDDILMNPKLIVEVLSPSTRNYDLGDKTRAYLQIPSLTDLLLVEQDKVLIEYWSREVGGEWNRKVFTGPTDILKIQSLDCDLPLAEIYSGVEFPPQEGRN